MDFVIIIIAVFAIVNAIVDIQLRPTKGNVTVAEKAAAKAADDKVAEKHSLELKKLYKELRHGRRAATRACEYGLENKIVLDDEAVLQQFRSWKYIAREMNALTDDNGNTVFIHHDCHFLDWKIREEEMAKKAAENMDVEVAEKAAEAKDGRFTAQAIAALDDEAAEADLVAEAECEELSNVGMDTSAAEKRNDRQQEMLAEAKRLLVAADVDRVVARAIEIVVKKANERKLAETKAARAAFEQDLADLGISEADIPF